MADSKLLRITFPTRDLINMTEQAQRAFANETQEILQVVGEALLAKVRRTYIDKGHGRTGEDEITWNPIQLGTLLARLRRSGHLARPGKQEKQRANRADADRTGEFHKVRRTNSSISIDLRQAVRSGLLKVLSGGLTRGKSGKQVYRNGTLFGVLKDRRSGRVSDSLKKRISPAAGGYVIGIDTGRQVATLQPGGKGDTAASVTYENNTVSIAAAMIYSPHFDKQRPIMPEALPRRWLDELEELVEEHAAKVIEHELGKQ